MSTDLLKTKVALVTGASRGIGQGIALALGKAGATVIGTATTAKGAEQITHALKAQNIQCLGMELNVTSSESINQLLTAVKEQYGPIDILVNNAAIAQDNLFLPI